MGGTFDRLHVGHAALLSTAFHTGRTVSIGLTTRRFLAEHPKPGAARIQPYSVRHRTLLRWLAARYPRSRWTVVPLGNPFGGSVADGVDALVVSADTKGGGRAVNAERRRRGRTAIPVVVVPLVLADDLRPISSRRIRSGEIDRAGRRRTGIRVGLAVEDDGDRRLSTTGIRRVFPRARVVRAPYPRGSGRRTSRLRSAAKSAARSGEVGVAVAKLDASGRAVMESVGPVTLAPAVLPRETSSGFSTALANWLGRAAPAKSFSPGRK
jgi:pantetheine-phosphate adenylyltransferase